MTNKPQPPQDTAWLNEIFGRLFHASPWSNGRRSGIKWYGDDGLDVTADVEEAKAAILAHFKEAARTTANNAGVVDSPQPLEDGELREKLIDAVDDRRFDADFPTKLLYKDIEYVVDLLSPVFKAELERREREAGVRYVHSRESETPEFLGLRRELLDTVAKVLHDKSIGDVFGDYGGLRLGNLLAGIAMTRIQEAQDAGAQSRVSNRYTASQVALAIRKALSAKTAPEMVSVVIEDVSIELAQLTPTPESKQNNKDKE